MILYDVRLFNRVGKFNVVINGGKVSKILPFDAALLSYEKFDLEGALLLPGFTAYIFDSVPPHFLNTIKSQGVTRVIAAVHNMKAFKKELQNSGLNFKCGRIFDGKNCDYGDFVYASEFDEGGISLAFNVAVKQSLPFFVRTPRTLNELGRMTEMFKCTPLELLESIGVLDKKACLVGCCHLDNEDLKLMKNYEVSAVVEPSLGIERADGFPELFAMLRRGILPGLHVKENIFKEMYLAKNISGLLLADSNAVSGIDMLKVACAGGPFGGGVEIEEGSEANLTAVKLGGPLNAKEWEDLVSFEPNFFNLSLKNVLLTMVKGNKIYGNLKAKK